MRYKEAKDKGAFINDVTKAGGRGLSLLWHDVWSFSEGETVKKFVNLHDVISGCPLRVFHKWRHASRGEELCVKLSVKYPSLSDRGGMGVKKSTDVQDVVNN